MLVTKQLMYIIDFHKNKSMASINHFWMTEFSFLGEFMILNYSKDTLWKK